MALTPMMEQYCKVKEQYPDAILFYRLGDFYEMFFDDAKLVSHELDLTLTGRDCGLEERAPMCGVPFHAADSYIGRLVRRGYKVVICEQMEDPATAVGLVKRDVIRIVTPGTVIENNYLEEGQNNYLCAISLAGGQVGLCFADISTGDISVTSIGGEGIENRLINQIGTFVPREILCDRPLSAYPALESYIEGTGAVVTCRADLFDYREAGNLILQTCSKTPAEMGVDAAELTCAVGALIAYIRETQKTDTSYIKEINVYSEEQYLEMDVNTRRNLELCETMRQKEKKGSLLWVLDRTRTAMGARQLRKWIEMPLLNCRQILRRQSAVSELHDSFMLREELGETLRGVLDLERLLTKVVYGTANARDLRAIHATLSVIPTVRTLLEEAKSEELASLRDTLDDLADICDLIDRSIVEEPPLIVREGGMIRSGYSAEVDRLNEIIHNGRGYIETIEASERERTGIKNLKIGYNRVFGYYIEVTRSFLDQVPPEYIRKQTLANAERFITQELKDLEATILGASDRIAALEYELFQQVRAKVAEAAARIRSSAEKLAVLDVYISLSDVAARYHYTCPEVEPGDVISIKEGRHPVVERFITDGYFVPNDTYLDLENNRMMLITGPNMAGKSTYMRQVALIVIMAQIGSFVPAADARIGIVDRVFTRVGASDDLASGQSTFMLEMNEVAYILRHATRRSLIIYDEIGRGTSTFDGMSIARAVAEYTMGKKIGAKSLFATHYHELTVLADEVPGIVNYNIAAKKKGDDVIFLRKILPGAADDSYGIEVAKLAGVPAEVIRRAREVLRTLEAKSEAIAQSDAPVIPEQNNITFEDMTADEIVDRIKKIDLDSMTPFEALSELYELKKLTK